MGYAFDGKCYSSADVVKEVFVSSYPRFSGFGKEDVSSVSIVWNGGKPFLNADLTLEGYGAPAPTTKTFSAGLAECDTAGWSFGALSPQDVLVGVGLVLAFVIGIGQGKRR